VADYAVIGIVNAWLFQAMEARLQNLQQAYDAQVAANLSQENEAQKLARQIRAPLLQARGELEPVLQAKTGPLNAQQRASVRSALDRLAAIQAQLDALPPAAPAPPTSPLRSAGSAR
jgi:DNA repair exonuclease SbcCD ATPase subunit